MNPNNIDFIKDNPLSENTLNVDMLTLGKDEILDDIINATNMGIWEWNMKTGDVLVNEHYARIIDYTLDELTPFTLSSWKDLVHHGDKEKVEMNLQGQIQGKSKHYDCELRMKKKDGSWIWVHNRGKVIRWDEDGNPIRMFGLIFDITDRKEEELEKLKLTIAIEQASVTVVMTDIDGNIQYGNPAFEKISGYSIDEAIGKNPRILKSGLTPTSVFDDLWETISSGIAWDGELINKRKDGTIYYEEARITPIIDNEGNIVNYLAIKQDVSQRKYLEEKLKQTSIRDSLTNLYNRGYVFERLSGLMKIHKKTNILFSLAIIDIDFFKNVNDTYGHQAGDFVLKEFAEILTQSIRTDDILGRYGGEEFILILKGINRKASGQIIERILERVKESVFSYEDKEIKIAFSGGVSDISEIHIESLSVEKLVSLADKRLYKAKNTGRSKIVIN